MSDQHDNSQSGSGNIAQHVHDATGRVLALVASLLAVASFGAVLAACILVPHLIEKSAQAAGASGLVRSQIAEREARIALEDVKRFEIELAKRGIHINREK